MITVEQCRAARGLLNWTQHDLAQASGLSKTAINNFERGISHMKAESLGLIRNAFEDQNIELIGHNGVRKLDDTVRILKGPDAMRRLWDDIFTKTSVLPDCEREVLITNVDERRTLDIEGEELIRHLNRLKEAGIAERLLVCEGDNFLIMPRERYRQIPKSLYTYGMSTYVYKGHVALQLWRESMIILVQSMDGYEAEKARFNEIWKSAKPIMPEK